MKIKDKILKETRASDNGPDRSHKNPTTKRE